MRRDTYGVPLPQLHTVLEAVSSCGSCRSLNLSGNDIVSTEEGTRALTAFLSLNSNVRRLDLCNCGIDSTCLTELTTALVQSTESGLVDWRLDDNRFGDEGASVIAKLCSHYGIRFLSLTHCGLTLSGWKALSTALHTNRTLVGLRTDSAGGVVTVHQHARARRRTSTAQSQLVMAGIAHSLAVNRMLGLAHSEVMV